MRLCAFGTWVSVTTLTMTAYCEGFVVPQPNGASFGMKSGELTTRLYGKLWKKLGIPEDIVNWEDVEEEEMYDEDEEEDRGPYWYVMNCVAGLEMELFEQALSVQRKMPELIQKVRVPTEKTIKSFGTKRHVVEDKVLYPGYVFLKMFLTEDTYEPLQQLPLCRSWMGTINLKGYSKLPPVPMALNPEEVQKFQGLEDDTDTDEEKLLEMYGGFRVEDMVKVLKGNFANEDGVVRRLKDGQICVRLYTYGSTYDEWMPIDHVRKMTDAEAMRGLTGPTEPVTQRSMESDQRHSKLDKNASFSKRNRDSGFGGERNRRMRRSGDDDSISEQRQRKQEEQNWKQYREEQREKTQQKPGDSWGLQEQSSWNSNNQQHQTDQDVERALLGDDDWTDFTSSSSSAGKKQSDNQEDDDFFNSLMDELSNTLDDTTISNSNQNNMSQKPKSSSDANQEDDFFSSLMSELEGDLTTTTTTTPKPPPQSKTRHTQTNTDEDDFFATLETDLNESLGQTEKSSSNTNTDEDDFFASLEADLNDSLSSSRPLQDTNAGNNDNDDDDFFATLEADLDTQLSSSNTHQVEDSFASNTLSSPTPKESNKSAGAATTPELNSLTVPALKELCRERGFKVGGKKADLIERLSQ